jgi:hypothetical protein
VVALQRHPFDGSAAELAKAALFALSLPSKDRQTVMTELLARAAALEPIETGGADETPDEPLGAPSVGEAVCLVG